MALRAQSEVGRIQSLLLKTPQAALINQQTVDSQWRELNYLDRPDFTAAVAEFDAFVSLLESQDINLQFLPASNTGMDSIYVRDASIITDDGAILCSMGKAARSGEPAACAAHYQGTLPVRGAITAPGMIEGGDVVWLGPRTVALGRGYRTNDAGIEQLRALLPGNVELIVVPLPHWQGPADVFHLMSMISPIDHDLLLVYSPLLPVPFRQQLINRGFDLIDVPSDEFDSMGANVLALAPRRCLMLEGNPHTRDRLEAAGVDVLTYKGEEISRKGCGGPTCLTRPLLRDI